MTDQLPVETDGAIKPHRSIGAALAAAQAEMSRAKKSAENPHFKAKYADLDSVCDAAMGALNRHGIAVVQPLQKDGDDWLVMTRFVHGETSEAMETPMPLLLGKRDMQGLGSAITYARRYGLMTLAMIAPEDDDGNAAVASGPAMQRAAPPPLQEEAPTLRQQADALVTKIRAAAGDKAKLAALWNANKPVMGALPDDIFEQVKGEFAKAAPKPTPTAAEALADDEIPF